MRPIRHILALSFQLSAFSFLAVLCAAQQTTALVDATTYEFKRPTTAQVVSGNGLLTAATAASTYQPLDADLTAIAGLTSAADRVPYFTGSGTAALATFTSQGRTLVSSTALTATGLSLTNGAAIDALGAVATNGGLYRTAANTYTARTITGTAGQITVTNGDGVSGAPTISLPSTITQATTFSAGTASTSTSTGAVIISGTGGLGVAGSIYAGGMQVSTQAGGAAAAVEGARLTNTTTTGSVYLNLNETNTTATPAYLIRYGSTHATKANVLEVVNAQSGADIRFITTGTGKVVTTAPTGGLGYGTGAGGAVTQITSRTTGVTLDKVTGAITLFTAAGSATAASFTVTNSTVAATDTIVLSVKSSTNKYLAFVTAVAAGSFEITFYTTGGTSSDAPVINFAVIKAVAS